MYFSMAGISLYKLGITGIILVVLRGLYPAGYLPFTTFR